jgi:phosphosulfolactate synthase
VNDHPSIANVGSFVLSLPSREVKPRGAGLTHVLDKGLTPECTAELLDVRGPDIDVWKFGWGTAYLDPGLERKIATLRAHGVESCLGGTLLEIAWSQGKAAECLAWAADAGFSAVEVSRGVADMPLDAKRELVKRAAETFLVLAETGVKDPRLVLPAQYWREEIEEDLAAGATWIIAEGRESGTVGLYDGSGRPRPDIIDAALAAAGLERLLFEAPRKDQQAWFIGQFGSDVNLGNIAPDDVLPLTTLRLGLRADTAHLSLGRSS